MAESLCCPPEIITSLLIGYTQIEYNFFLIFKKKKIFIDDRPIFCQFIPYYFANLGLLCVLPFIPLNFILVLILYLSATI